MKYSKFVLLKNNLNSKYSYTKDLGNFNAIFIFFPCHFSHYPSPQDYITYIDDNLSIQEKSKLGYHIGNLNFVSPTCADDMVILARSPLELQTLLNLVNTYANEEHYILHPEKSVIIPFNVPMAEYEMLREEKPWEINGNRLPVTKDLEHVGIQRTDNSVDPTVAQRIKSGRSTLYGLFGAGMHGRNGLPVHTALHLYDIYVMPRVLYGLEVLNLSKPNITALEVFQRSVLRMLLDLPDRTAIPALYIITGRLPIKKLLDQRKLMFLHGLISTEGRLKELVERQYVVKKKNSKSWVAKMKETLHEYSLPSLQDMLNDPPTKDSWKESVKRSVVDNTALALAEECRHLSSLQYINPSFKHKTCHIAVASVDNPRQVSRASIKCKMLTGTYLLHKRGEAKDKCVMCQEEAETIPHILLECSATLSIRNKYLPSILKETPWINTSNHSHLLQVILDPTHPSVLANENPVQQIIERIEKVSRDYCFAIHIRRYGTLSQL